MGAKGARVQGDVLQQFVDSARTAGVGYGFYYSIMKSFYLARRRDSNRRGRSETSEPLKAAAHTVRAPFLSRTRSATPFRVPTRAPSACCR